MVRSTERREGVSMVEVVMDDMAIGNPASPVAQRWRFWASFPGIHIAQFHFQVIGNCGVISLMRRNNPLSQEVAIRAPDLTRVTAGGLYSFVWLIGRSIAGNYACNCRLAVRAI